MVCVVSRIDRAASIFRDSASQQQNGGVVVAVYVSVSSQAKRIRARLSLKLAWGVPVINPLARNVDGGVMAIVSHIGHHEHSLREGRGIDIGCKVI